MRFYIMLFDSSLGTSVLDLFRFDTDPDPQNRFVEKLIRPKIEKIPTFLYFFMNL